MSQQGPILVVSSAMSASFAAALGEAKLFPVIETGWTDARHALEQVEPAAVLVADPGTDESSLASLASLATRRQPYLPLIVIDPQIALPDNALPFFQAQGDSNRLLARLRAALRVRSLHATVMRRLDPTSPRPAISEIDTANHATALLIGRGAAYPALSISLGERTGVVGALSIEAAANHLNTRDIDGIVLSDGFAPRVIEAFLTVLSEDARFRHLPVVVASDAVAVTCHGLANLEFVSGTPQRIAAIALPLIRQHAFETLLNRTLRSIDADGLIDVRTGLLTSTAFNRDFATAVYQAVDRGGGLSTARFTFDPTYPRVAYDGARIISRLMRKTDFGAMTDDGSVVVAFAETDLKTAHVIARRLSSVMRHTSDGRRDARSEPFVTIATLQPSDSAKSLLARLTEQDHRAAS